jgi:hypothetical protein
MADNNSADVASILKALAVLVNGQDSVSALSGMMKHERSTWFPLVKYDEKRLTEQSQKRYADPPYYRIKLQSFQALP